jgi:biopolymer transport protein ExbD
MRLDVQTLPRRTTGLTALVDVVFLLLLFFMLASSFSRFSVIEVGLGGGGAAVPGVQAMQTLVTVDENATLLVNGRPVPREAFVQALQEAASTQTGGRIIVRPTARATAQDIVTSLELARSAEAGDVILVR